MRPMVIALALVGTACDAGPADPDQDGDGLHEELEVRLGTDPADADTDDDSLLDGEEVYDHRTDPTLADTDGDTYLDPWELAEGTDPEDPDDRIYAGYWPYNPFRDAMSDPGYDGIWAVGERAHDHAAQDAYGDRVHLYDFLERGRDVVVHATATWNVSGANDGADYLPSWLASAGYVDPSGLDGTFEDVRLAVDHGDLTWVTILTDARELADVQPYQASYDHPAIPVLADPNHEIGTLIETGVGYLPAGALLDEHGAVVAFGGIDHVLQVAQQRLDERQGR